MNETYVIVAMPNYVWRKFDFLSTYTMIDSRISSYRFGDFENSMTFLSRMDAQFVSDRIPSTAKLKIVKFSEAEYCSKLGKNTVVDG